MFCNNHKHLYFFHLCSGQKEAAKTSEKFLEEQGQSGNFLIIFFEVQFHSLLNLLDLSNMFLVLLK